LNHTPVGNNTRASSQCINFTDYLALCYSTHGGITGHLSHVRHVHGNQQNLAAQFSGSIGCFTPGVTSTNNNYIKPIFQTDYVSRGTFQKNDGKVSPAIQ
jgi:hypothetical protein